MIRPLTMLMTAALFSISMPSQAQIAYPMLMSIEPVAVQLGSTSEHTVRSRYSMSDAYAVMVSGAGVRGEILPPEPKLTVPKGESKSQTQSAEQVIVRFTVDSDALSGVRDVRVATPTGVSTVGQLLIVSDPVIHEELISHETQASQVVSIPSAVCGRIDKAEDVDHYQFSVLKGEELSFQVNCMRLQDRVHDLQQHADPIIAIKNASGSIVASADNELRGDPFVRHKFDQAGEYVLEIRDVRYQGNAFWVYCIEINRHPFVSGIYPIGLARGSPVQLELIGYGLTDQSSTELGLPGDVSTGPLVWPVSFGKSFRQPVAVVVADQLPQCESAADNNSVATAQSIALPGGINGRIETEGDVDLYAFDAKKGERLTFDLMASRTRSALDSHLRILNHDGNQLQISDDVRIGKRTVSDSIIENWSAPNDGRYFVEIRDLHLRGGKAYTYFLNVTRSAPNFALYTDTDKTHIWPGTTGVVFVRAERKNGADGDIQLHVAGLPTGVTASCGRILAGNGQDGCIVLQSAPGTAPIAENIQISGTMQTTASDGTDSQLSAHAVVYQEIYQPGGGRGHWPVENHALAVCAPGDIRRISLSTNEITLKLGSSQRIDVELERAEGFDKNVTLEMTYMHLNNIFGNSLPAGVTVDAAASNTLLTAGASKGHIALKAADTAPEVDRQQTVLMANVSINFVMKATYASQPVFVTVKK